MKTGKHSIVKALLELGDDISKLDPWLPFPQNSCCYSFGKESRPLPIGALMILWEKCPEAVWECPKCGGKVYTEGFGGLLGIGGFRGYCIDCGERSTNMKGGLVKVNRIVEPYLKKTPYFVKGMVFGGTIEGRKRPLYDALKKLGVKDLPGEEWADEKEESICSFKVKDTKFQINFGARGKKEPVRSRIWSDGDNKFFPDLDLQPVIQKGPACVATALATASGTNPGHFLDFPGFTNMNPVSWSDALTNFNMKLAYCPTDTRKVKYYADELLQCDDLFIIGYYSPNYKHKDETDILLDPADDGKESALSHAVILYKDKIYDSKNGTVTQFKEHQCIECHTKRIFRFVPSDYKRGI